VSESEYQEPPEIKADNVQNGLMCFLDASRECGAECMAFITEPVEAPNILGPQQRNCILIVSAERVGRYMSGLVQLVKKGQEKTDKEAADRKRTQVAPPPDPRGNKT